jgi:release factor glutamine methyltransferase
VNPRTDAAAGSLSAAIRAARDRLVRAGVPEDEAALDADVLARTILGWDRAALLARGRDAPPPGFSARFDAVLQRRVAREPVAYIVGTREFWGLEVEVTPDVLVPRPETEILVEQVLLRASRTTASPLIADVGTGSGCLAVSLARELPRARLVATDTSAAALAVAARNAARHGVRDQVRFVRTDLLTGLSASFDLIVSNPPYVPATDAPTLQPEVARFEPPRALYGGADGLSVIGRLLEDAPARLRPGAPLIMEIGFGQREAVEAIAEAAGWTDIRFVPDLAGIDRAVVLSR